MGYGIWAIILPVFAMPIYVLLAYILRRAEKEGIITREKKPQKFNIQ
jgi:hypothetical protein